MMAAGVPVGAGTDATRVASYNPWVSLSWLVTSKTVGGMRLYPVRNRLDRETALRLWTQANTWFSNEQGKKGQIMVGQLADLAVLSDDYFSVAEDDIAHLGSVLTLLGGKVVHGVGDYAPLAPELPRPMPDWSPVATFGGYHRSPEASAKMAAACGCASSCGVHGHDHAAALGADTPTADPQSFWGHWAAAAGRCDRRSGGMRRGHALCCLAVLAPAPALAQTEAWEPPTLTITRYDEDWSTMGAKHVRGGGWTEPFKHIALSDTDDSDYIVTGIELRARNENYQANELGNAQAPGDSYLWLRAMPYADLHVGIARAFVQPILAYAVGVSPPPVPWTRRGSTCCRPLPM
jgi:hypothetical protein